MKEPGINLIKKFHLEELNIDFMGYELMPNDIFTFHHLLIPSCRKGPYIECNGVILCCSTSHPYLHVIENTDYDMFLNITSEMLDELIKGYLDKENLQYIRDILNSFEKEYIATGRCSLKVKSEYFERPSLKERMVRKRVL